MSNNRRDGGSFGARKNRKYSRRSARSVGYSVLNTRNAELDVLFNDMMRSKKMIDLPWWRQAHHMSHLCATALQRPQIANHTHAHAVRGVDLLVPLWVMRLTLDSMQRNTWLSHVDANANDWFDLADDRERGAMSGWYRDQNWRVPLTLGTAHCQDCAHYLGARVSGSMVPVNYEAFGRGWPTAESPEWRPVRLATITDLLMAVPVGQLLHASAALLVDVAEGREPELRAVKLRWDGGWCGDAACRAHTLLGFSVEGIGEFSAPLTRHFELVVRREALRAYSKKYGDKFDGIGEYAGRLFRGPPPAADTHEARNLNLCIKHVPWQRSIRESIEVMNERTMCIERFDSLDRARDPRYPNRR